jgi:hypothetical protein
MVSSDTNFTPRFIKINRLVQNFLRRPAYSMNVLFFHRAQDWLRVLALSQTQDCEMCH